MCKRMHLCAGFPYTQYQQCSSNLCWRTDGAHAQWQASREDLKSAVQNPGFNNPAYPADDYSLPKGSPGVGFKMFANPVKSFQPIDGFLEVLVLKLLCETARRCGPYESRSHRGMARVPSRTNARTIWSCKGRGEEGDDPLAPVAETDA
jgi:hypothetical protein